MRLVYSLMLSSMALQIPGLDEDKQDANNFLRFFNNARVIKRPDSVKLYK